ncbi:gamma-aminobutyric acid type B receptor subunit 2-like [Amphiura filiformis]|uniref:gamma-aminobutyric acid type B receptor subunit 2-like n=1 Tax=Amphiura filiformis TaxID=82378 RepID=UPI003B21CDD1
MARKIFCEAYIQDMTGPGYVWIIYGWYDNLWWLEKDNTIGCTVMEMDMAISSATILTIGVVTLSSEEGPTISGLTPQELQSQFEDRLAWPINGGFTRTPETTYSAYGYDTAWAIALVLNKSIEVLKEKVFSNGKKRRLENFTYKDGEMAQMFLYLMKEIEFDGASGYVAFKNGDRLGDLVISQMQGNLTRHIALYSTQNERLKWINNITWNGGFIPSDHTEIIKLRHGIGWRLYTIMGALAGIGFMLACFFGGFNVKYRKHSIVKMSSPNLNSIIIIGSTFGYLSVIVRGLDGTVLFLETAITSCQVLY